MQLIDSPMSTLLTVISVAPDHPTRATRLAAMGIVVGSELTVRQRYPAFIVEYDETTLALDSEVAAEVEVGLALEQPG